MPSSASNAFALSSNLRLANGEVAIGPAIEAGFTCVARKFSISAITRESGISASLWVSERSASSIWAAYFSPSFPSGPSSESGIGMSDTDVVNEAASAWT